MISSSKFIVSTRKKLELTQEQFGEKIGYSRSYVRDIELGKVTPSRRFLEALSSEFKVSVDSLLSINPILNIIDRNRGHENPNIPFLMGFTQDEIDGIEKYLKELFVDRDSIFIDGSSCNSVIQLDKAITNKEGDRRKQYDLLKKMLLNKDNEIMLVIKNISLSKIKNKSKGGHIKDIFKIMDDAQEFKKVDGKVISGHKDPKSCLILIDFPSFLERQYEQLGYYSIPIYPDFLQRWL